MLTHRIPRGVPEMPARRYIRRAWPLLPEREVREAFARRDVKKNGARIAPADTVRGGDELTLYVNASFPLDVLFDDGHLLAVVKPQGLPVDVDQDGVGEDTLLARLRAYNENARLLHRLDAQTGGVLLAALEEKTYQSGLTAFREHQLVKTYRAVAKGPFPAKAGESRDYLSKDARRATRARGQASRRRREAHHHPLARPRRTGRKSVSRRAGAGHGPHASAARPHGLLRPPHFGG